MADEGQAGPRYRRRIAGIAVQVGLIILIGGLIYAAAYNAAQNLARAHIASGFGFWNNTAGFDISQALIAYSPAGSTFGRAFWVGLLNTLLVAAIGILLATMLGFAVGIARLSRNWLVARLAAGYVEVIRNVPLLLQLYFWYNAVLKSLPDVRDSIALAGGGFLNNHGPFLFLNNRGLFLPRPEFGSGFSAVLAAFLAGVLGAIVLRLWARRRQERTGAEIHVLWPALALLCALPFLAFALTGTPLTFSPPQMGRFNVRGGLEILPEFAALTVGLTTYTAAFIAEVVRAGVLSVSAGQAEAAQALGLRSGTTLRLVIVPQAMRVIIPPLTSQYLNLIKNSSLAVAIGYPDLVQVFTGTVLNITGQAVEVVAITMAVYLTISLFASLLMNLYARTTSVVEH